MQKVKSSTLNIIGNHKEGVRNLSAKEVQEVQGKDFNHATRDLFDAIEKEITRNGIYTYK